MAESALGMVLDWFGCATFRLRAQGVTILLDAYIDRVAGAPGPGLTADDVDECDWMVIGHSHFDHLYGADRIAGSTGCRIIGSYETIRVLESCGVPIDQMICVSGGERIQLADGLRVSVYPSQHSCVWTHRQMPRVDEVCIGDLGVTWQEQAARLADLGAYYAGLGGALFDHLRSTHQGARGDGGSFVYLFETPEGSLLYQDTSGCWTGVLRDLRPDVAILAAAGRGNLDGDPIQGSLAQFVAREVALLRPRQVVLSHHDDWLPGFSVETDVGPIRSELSRLAPRAELREIGYLDGTVL
jgi:L-ascorbate metabolism protein UlaG (beta-lactamase superfamily)